MTERLIDRLTLDQIEAIFNALPIEFIFVDQDDRLQYYNKGEKRTRPGPDNILGQDIRALDANGNLKLENEESAEITLRVQNIGGSPSFGTTVEFTPAQENYIFESAESHNIGDLYPGNFRDITVKISSVNNLSNSVRIDVGVFESSNKYSYGGDIEIPLNTAQKSSNNLTI